MVFKYVRYLLTVNVKDTQKLPAIVVTGSRVINLPPKYLFICPPLAIKDRGEQSHLRPAALLALHIGHQPETQAATACWLFPWEPAVPWGRLVTLPSFTHTQLTMKDHTPIKWWGWWKSVSLQPQIKRMLWPQTKKECRQASFKFC